ncbi:MAG TPA: cupin domain-containing protein [Candidatus Angelobacter sp.]|nr:cupin domain-containing protein [Candidatus Angelobacter sp.]
MPHKKVQSVRTSASTTDGAAPNRPSAVRMEMKQGTLTHNHHHESECLMVVLEGVLRISLRGQMVTVRANEMLHIPPQHEHFAEAIADSVALSISTSAAAEWSGCGPFVHEDPDQYLWGV